MNAIPEANVAKTTITPTPNSFLMLHSLFETTKSGNERSVKLGSTVIPKDICEELDLGEGDFVEVTRSRGTVVIKPKKLIDADDLLTPSEEARVRTGEQQLRQHRSRPWKEIKCELDR